MKKTLNSGLIAALAMAVSTTGVHPGIWDVLDPGLPDPNDDEIEKMTTENTEAAVTAINKAEEKRLRKQRKNLTNINKPYDQLILDHSGSMSGWPCFGGFRKGELVVFAAGPNRNPRTIMFDTEATNIFDINDLTKISPEDIEKEAEHIISTLDDYHV